TKDFGQFHLLANEILHQAKEARIFNTICTVTKHRHKAAVNLAGKVDVMLIVGGKNSSNTGNLYQSCKNTGAATYHIEGASEIAPEWFEGAQRVGITAGASTQQWIIKEVEEFMGELSEKGNNEQKEEMMDQGLENELVSEELDTSQEEESEQLDATTKEEQEIHPMDSAEALGYNKSLKEFHKGMIVTGRVVEIQDDGIFLDIGYKTEGFIPLHELGTQPIDNPHESFQAGQEINVVFLGTDDEGQIRLSKKRADADQAWEKILEAEKNDSILTGKVTKVVKGGLVADVGLRGFIPASHIAIEFVEDLEQFIDQTIEMKILEVEKKNNNVVLSRKKVLEERQAEEKQKTMSTINEGDLVKGLVTKIVDFGAFVDIGGIEGLLHISEMSWGRIEHPSKVIAEGEEIEVKILNIDQETERISLGLKQVLPDPWETFVANHNVGDKIEGRITKIVSFGAFMELQEGIEGLIHISQLARRHVESPDEVVKKDELVTAKIININKEERRVGLSLKELEIDTQKKEVAQIIEQREEASITIADI
ncbi:30S ribosomal protein S1, partial [bacterium]|nr:30S ribosomal protein S1 [bacterium]